MSEMNVRKSGSGKPILWFVSGFLVTALVLAGVIFSGKVGWTQAGAAQGAARLPVAAAEVKDAAATKDAAGVTDAAEIEAKLREEYDEKLRKEIAALKEAQDGLNAATPPMPPPARSAAVLDVRKLGGGMPFRTEMLYGRGDTAVAERSLADGYTASYQIKLRLPRPAISMKELESGTPGLSKILPGLAPMMPPGKISPWFSTLNTFKSDRVRKDAYELNLLPTLAEIYECNTMLHLQSQKGRKVFFMQADMDAFTGGSDGDRLPEMPEAAVNSLSRQPFTSYSWPKRGETPNPMIAGWESRIGLGNQELTDPKTTPERKKAVEERIAMIQQGVAEMKKRSYLISEYDPFIVIPLQLLAEKKDPFAPKVGDYAVVIHGGKIYPSMVGSAGADDRVGEASLRMRRELEKQLVGVGGTVADVSVSYVVFPGSADSKPGPPDYAKMRERCLELANEIGGFGEGFTYHVWTDLLAKEAE